MEQQIKEWISSGINDAVIQVIQAVKEGLKSGIQYFISSIQFGVVDIGLFVLLAYYLYLCFALMIAKKEKREETAGKIYFTTVFVFIARIAYMIILRR